MHRVDELADVKIPEKTKHIPYKNLIPLQEIIADVCGVGKNSKKVLKQYFELTDKYSEFEILLDLSIEELKKITDNNIAEAIYRVRDGRVNIIPGYDGVYGKIDLQIGREAPKQKTLF